MIRRGFAEIAEGQVHYRMAGQGGRPLVMLHASPGSSRQLVTLIQALARSRRTIAPDTLGNGDSCPAAPAEPDIHYYADTMLRFLDALGLERVDLYGTHTGASIAMEMAIARPDRVGRLILDGMGLYSPDELADILSAYAPAVAPDQGGAQLWWAWHFVRDQYQYWPWFKRDAAHARGCGLPEPGELHAQVVEVLKAVTTYHLSYRAAFRHPKRDRLPLVPVPALAAAERDDMLFGYLDEVARLLPGGRRAELPGHATPEAAGATAALLADFLDAG
ncbi:MAG: hypothetical protein OHK0024_01470 [Thalassobaculales bacterium]